MRELRWIETLCPELFRSSRFRLPASNTLGELDILHRREELSWPRGNIAAQKTRILRLSRLPRSTVRVLSDLRWNSGLPNWAPQPARLPLSSGRQGKEWSIWHAGRSVIA